MRSSRLELRLAESDRVLLDRAAARSGESVSEFVRGALRDRAAEVLRDDTTIALSEVDAAAFLRQLDEVDEQSVDALRELRQRAAGDVLGG